MKFRRNGHFGCWLIPIVNDPKMKINVSKMEAIRIAWNSTRRYECIYSFCLIVCNGQICWRVAVSTMIRIKSNLLKLCLFSQKYMLLLFNRRIILFHIFDQASSDIIKSKTIVCIVTPSITENTITWYFGSIMCNYYDYL